MMDTISKFFKKRRLLKKYVLTNEKMLNDLSMTRIMKDDKDFMDYYRHIRYCELRCYGRLKNLK